MDGLILDVPAPERLAPFMPPICLSPLTAQILAIALVVALCAALIPTESSRR